MTLSKAAAAKHLLGNLCVPTCEHSLRFSIYLSTYLIIFQKLVYLLKIRNYILNYNLEQSLKPLPSKGIYDVEGCFDLMYNRKIDNIVFVVCLDIEYSNYSINKKSYKVFAFDTINGNLIPKYQESGKCYDGFFQDLELIEEII